MTSFAKLNAVKRGPVLFISDTVQQRQLDQGRRALFVFAGPCVAAGFEVKHEL